MTGVVVALLFIMLGIYTDALKSLRSVAGSVAAPVYYLTDLPERLMGWGQDTLVSREQLLEDNAALKAELLIHNRKLQQMASLAAENVRLRQLLGSAEMLKDRVLVAELIGVSPDPLTHRVVINKGRRHGVTMGQPLLDAHGLMGQVVEVNEWTSHVLLITDVTHALPVQINRNGVRAVAEGVGDLYHLKLRHVANTVDVREGDLLVSSGLGQRFPVGYPVAEVTSVINNPGKAFAEVWVAPKAQLNRSRHVLLVFSGEDAEAQEQSASEEG